MFIAQIILLSQWFSEKNQAKKPNQNGQVQNGILVKLDMGAKKPYEGIFLLEFHVKKVVISCDEQKNKNFINILNRF